MSTIKVRSMPIDHIGYRTVRLLYNGLPAVRSLVHRWHDGDHSWLLKRDNREFLRRLVVRALKDLTASNEESESYGGTSSDESSNLVHEIEEASGPFKEINKIQDMFSLCSCCGAEGYELYILKSTRNSQFYGACVDCYESLTTFECSDLE